MDSDDNQENSKSSHNKNISDASFTELKMASLCSSTVKVEASLQNKSTITASSITSLNSKPINLETTKDNKKSEIPAQSVGHKAHCVVEIDEDITVADHEENDAECQNSGQKLEECVALKNTLSKNPSSENSCDSQGKFSYI